LLSTLQFQQRNHETVRLVQNDLPSREENKPGNGFKTSQRIFAIGKHFLIVDVELEFVVDSGPWGFPSALSDRRLLLTGFSSFLSSRHHDTAAPPRSRPAANHDIDVAVQRGQKIHQAFDGKAVQLIS
jgi:hypothetical protein